jgi:hypothetical protein
MFGEDYEEVMKNNEKNKEVVDPEKESLEIARLQEEFKRTLTLEIAVGDKAQYKDLPVEELIYSKTSMNRIIKLSSSRYNDQPKSRLISSLDEKVRLGEPFVKEISTGSCSMMNNLGGWSYLVVLDKDGQLWVIDWELTRKIYKISRRSA